MRRWRFFIILLFVIAAVVLTIIWLRPKPLISKDIKRQVTYTVFIPVDPPAVNQPGTVKFDSKLKLLSYSSTVFGIHTVISEQPTPETFTDIPAVYQKVLDSWNQYASFDSSLGTVYLTKPKNNGNKQVGVMNSKGTLMFIKADSNLSKDQWRQLFNSLEIAK